LFSSGMRRKVTKVVLKKLKYYMSNASTRNEAYLKISEEFGISIGTIKNAASKAGITSPMHSLQYILSAREEEALVAICVKNAHRNEPLTIPDFIELVSRYKRFPESERVSRHFVTNFVKRHKNRLCIRTGKMTSPKRSSDVMLQLTEDFISLLQPLYIEHRINPSTLVVFDETVIGESAAKQLFIGSRRNTGGGNINVFRRRGKAVGSVTPFSMVNGSTPFRVFVKRVGKKRKAAGSEQQQEQDVRVIRTATSYKLYLSSESGYITLPLFRCVMEHFTKWWNESFPDLECYLICDNLRIHTNKSIVEFAKTKGVHIITIMPGTSHWFQVHDQKPFGTLKKKMAIRRNQFSRAPLLPSKAMKDFMMGIYSLVEKEAFAPHIIIKSFEDVGLYPWCPEKIRDLCREHCPPPSQLNGSCVVKKLERIMKTLSAEQEAEQRRIISIGKSEMEGSSENSTRYQLRERKKKIHEQSEDKTRRSFSRRKTMGSKIQPPSKRSRTMKTTH